LAEALSRGGRPRHAARLIAVTKTYGSELIRPLLAAGHREFGENRVQEALVKYPDLRREFPDLVLHLIGPLQSNKTREAVELFDVIQTLDRPKLAEALAAERARGAKLPRLLVQVNTGEEPQKAGLAPRDLEDFLTNVSKKLDLAVEGLMCIPPAGEPPGPHFALLAKLAKTHGLPVLSMGMSGDFETAAALGATHVRVGSAIFGTRS
jgi:pyridoxal phosphate enzyme (YggS family)